VRGKYRVDAFLAAGTMANVYAATHRNGSRVALKVLHREYAFDPKLTERFKREGYFANSIGHPGVVRAIDDDFTEDGCPFLVMELLEGETLEQRRVRKGGRLELLEALGIADAILDVLAAAHEKHVLHRDMKPDNVFLTKTGELKLLDFGVARWDDGLAASEMTGAGMVLGTPAFMPPEQALGRREEVDARSDLWGVGAMLFVVLTGRPVHAGDDAKQKLIATARTPAQPIQQVEPNVPRSVAQVIDRALAFDRDARWPDANAMREALRWARMSLEPVQDKRGRIPTLTDEVPAPAPTRRNFDEEQTLARRYTTDEHDVVTSAPRMRPAAGTPVGGVPAASASSPSGPVFSLRRTRDRDDDEPQPSTQRFDRSPADEEPRSIDVSLSGLGYTRPMAAVTPPDGGPKVGAAETPSQPFVPPALVNADIRKTLPFGVFATPAQGAPPPMQTAEPFPPVQVNAPAPAVAAPAPEPLPGPRPPALTHLSMPPPPEKAPKPGPMVTEVEKARSKGQGLRVAIVLLVAALVLGGVYVGIVKRQMLAGGPSPTPAPTPSASEAPVTTVAAASAAPSATVTASAAASVTATASASATAPASAVASAAAAPAVAVDTRRTPRPRPRPRPRASAEPAASASAAPAETSLTPAKDFESPPPEAPKPAETAPAELPKPMTPDGTN
jgi:serine/threonine-protein kinase